MWVNSVSDLQKVILPGFAQSYALNSNISAATVESVLHISQSEFDLYFNQPFTPIPSSFRIFQPTSTATPPNVPPAPNQINPVSTTPPQPPVSTSIDQYLADAKALMIEGESPHLHDTTLFQSIVSALSLNTQYATDSAGYIYPTNYGTAYREECVALALALVPSLPTNTNNWTNKGSLQVDLNGQPNPALQPGTPIATFNPNGSYPASGVLSDGTIAHTAIFLGYGSVNGQFGMYILDQYTAHPGIQAQPAEIRFDPFTTVNQNLYYSIGTI